jgi:hypothetical protein
VGARLHYAKVIDREQFVLQGGRIHPGLVNRVCLDGEQWRLEAPGGLRIYESLPRELHMPTNGHVEKLEDEVADLEFEFAADDYEAVFLLDEREVARLNFKVADGRRRR